jgi:hypothetical protein
MLSQQPPDYDPQLGPGRLFYRPVYGRIFPDSFNQLLGNLLQRFVTKHLYRAVVDLQSIVEGQLILTEAEIISAFVSFFHLLGQLDQLFDDLGRLNGAIVILVDRFPPPTLR